MSRPKYHPGRSCSRCYLCGKQSYRYHSHYGAWESNEKEFLLRYWPKEDEPPPSACICFSHYQEAKRHHPSSYVPKWSKVNPIETDENKILCAYHSCTISDKLIKPLFAPIEELKAVLQFKGNDLRLCNEHYQELYKNFSKVQLCASCGVKPKKGTRFVRFCPNVDLINKLLENTEGESLKDNDTICCNCYKSHLAMINLHEHQNELSDLINMWELKSSTEPNKLTRSILQSAIYVAEHFQNDRAVLLPQVCKFFLQKYFDSTDILDSSEHTLENREGTVKFSSRWLLHQLSLHLSVYMNHKCVHKKFGIILYKKGGDLLTSLSWALGTSTPPERAEYISHTNINECNTALLKGAGDLINNIVHSEIRRLSNQNYPDSLNFDNEIAKIDPSLWSFLECISRTVREQRQLKCTREALGETSHLKKLRRYFLYCLLLYCTNTQQPLPIHLILADTIEVCGGSHKLIQIFNQLGVVCSTDTHDRFVTKVATSQRNKSIWDNLSPDTLTIASVDNFDMLQSFSAVYCGDQHRSYHGTTIQIVQPNPSIKINTSLTSCPPKHSLELSPSNSPHKLEIACPKRPRTLIPRNLAQQLEAASHASLSTTYPTSITNIASIANITNVTSIPNITNTAASTANATLGTYSDLTINDFKEKADEKVEREAFQMKMLAYNFLKAHLPQHEEKLLREFKDLFSYATQGSVTKSNVYYMELVNENADSSDTMRYVAELLLNSASSESQDGFVILVGDGKTFQHLVEIKRTYGFALNKLLIFPGEWHILANFQPVLMKIYYHAGLKQLAQASGFRAETLTSLEKCSNFARTHQFLLQVWQAMYCVLIENFNDGNSLLDDLSEDMEIHCILSAMAALIQDKKLDTHFQDHLSKMMLTDETYKFWYQFVFIDCSCYIQLYIAIRSQNWHLRNSALKVMAPLFSAYDRTTYQRLIPYHLADLQCFPSTILSNLEKGFTISINGGKGHAIALDEAHEMLINKDLKMAVTRPTQAYLQKTSLFMRSRISLHKDLLVQLFPKINMDFKPLFGILTNDPALKKREKNIITMVEEIKKVDLFPDAPLTSRGLVNAFTHMKATPEQTHDMMNFREIGSSELEIYINHFLLKKPSTKAPVRKNKLLTMAPTKMVGKRMLNMKQKELKQITKCLRQRLAWCNRTGQAYDSATEQYSLYPRAIADEQGYPLKGVKSIWKEKLSKRYPTVQVVLCNLPNQWQPNVVILDAMFYLNCKPLRNVRTIRDYSIFLYNRFVLTRYNAQVKEVHLLFDYHQKEQSESFNPKFFEQIRRDRGKETTSHNHIEFTPSTEIVHPWKPFIDCRQCKASIIEALGISFLQTIRQKLISDQILYLSGCFPHSYNTSTYKFEGSCLPQPMPRFSSNSREADMRIWRHASQTEGTNILVYSPDTDIYNIGIPLLNHLPGKRIVVQVNVPHSPDCSYIHLNNLVAALELDPDLASLPRQHLPSILQMLFVCSGCDYISYFYGQGKSAFFNNFFQHAQFISGKQAEGFLCDISCEKREQGFLSFLRLIGTLYFKKHFSAIASLRNVETPQQLFQSHEESCIKDKHIAWYNDIRSIVSERISDERERAPSHTSLWRHWIRCCWVGLMWANSILEDIHTNLPCPEASGWKKNSDGSFQVDWECPEVERTVQRTINFLTRGCSCKKGCTTQRCGCVQKGHQCGPGCNCHNCQNTLSSQQQQELDGSQRQEELDESMDSNSSDTDTDSDQENIETEIISDIYHEQNNFIIDPEGTETDFFSSLYN